MLHLQVILGLYIFFGFGHWDSAGQNLEQPITIPPKLDTVQNASLKPLSAVVAAPASKKDKIAAAANSTKAAKKGKAQAPMPAAKKGKVMTAVTKKPPAKKPSAPKPKAPSHAKKPKAKTPPKPTTKKPTDVNNGTTKVDDDDDDDDGVGIQTRIMGGKIARPNEFPYQVGILFHNVIGCGGSIINANWILTASHCFEHDIGEPPIKPSVVKVVAGEHSFKKKEGPEQTLQVKEIISHEKWDKELVKHDITLLKLATPIKLNAKVKAVTLAAANRKPDSGDVIVTGWGHSRDGGTMSDILQKVTLPIVPVDECAKIYEDNNVTSEQICTGKLGVGGMDACQGDSGGPLVKKEKDKFIQIGVVSYGAKCGAKEHPGVYTSVAAYRKWIDAKIKGK